jgi:adenosylcobinamide-GDP ribazoletransferase
VITEWWPVAPFLTAVAFLTRIPVRPARCTPEAIGGSTSFFPLVGAGLGGVSVIVLWIVQRAMPPTLAAALIVLTGILLTGGLHFDGLADMMDGFGGGRTRADVLRIMRDHHIGTYATLAVVMAVVLQIAAISTLIDTQAADRWLVIAPTGSRWAMVLLGWRMPYARADAGLGRAITDHVRNRDMLGATIVAVAIVTAVARWSGVVGLCVMLAQTAAVAFRCWQRIGGVTGDTLGANAVLCETMGLVAGVWVTGLMAS